MLGRKEGVPSELDHCEALSDIYTLQVQIHVYTNESDTDRFGVVADVSLSTSEGGLTAYNSEHWNTWTVPWPHNLQFPYRHILECIINDLQQLSKKVTSWAENILASCSLEAEASCCRWNEICIASCRFEQVLVTLFHQVPSGLSLIMLPSVFLVHTVHCTVGLYDEWQLL